MRVGILSFYGELRPAVASTYLRGIMFVSAQQCPSVGIQELINAGDFIQEQHLMRNLC